MKKRQQLLTTTRKRRQRLLRLSSRCSANSNGSSNSAIASPSGSPHGGYDEDFETVDTSLMCPFFITSSSSIPEESDDIETTLDRSVGPCVFESFGLLEMFKCSVHDMTMHAQDHPQLDPGEQVLANKGYVGPCGRGLSLIVPFKATARSPLTPFKLEMHSVKHIIVEHSFGGQMTDSYLWNIVKVIIHSTTMYTFRNQQRYP
ncbi:hypothetical protein BDR26DRAFT_1010307 [Obelidium mucronatum]|nr:hypothetical protein BDR26DRAFT_1010307 [Obelidium mucronatum]